MIGQVKEDVIRITSQVGEISLELLKEIEPNDRRRYKLMNELKQCGFYRIYEEGRYGYRINWKSGRGSKVLQEEKRRFEENGGVAEQRVKKRDQNRTVQYNRCEVYRQLYNAAGIRYRIEEKPVLSRKFPYTQAVEENFNAGEIREALEAGALFYSIAELKKRPRATGGIESDDVLKRNRSSGILLMQDAVCNVYSFPLAQSLNLKWTKKTDEPLYMMLRRLSNCLGIPMRIGTIYIGQNMEIAREFIEKDKEARTGTPQEYGVTIDNCGVGGLYYIPSEIERGGKRVKTRQIEYLSNARFKGEMDGQILAHAGGERVESTTVLGRTEDGATIYNLLDFNLKKVRSSLKAAQPIIYCFDWQRDVIEEAFEKCRKEAKIYALEEERIINVMEK